jgi:tRNA (mo5U34)-methyltransferase
MMGFFKKIKGVFHAKNEPGKPPGKSDNISIDQEDWHYHTLRDSHNQLIWEGQYDLYPLWKYFGITEDLSGQSCIDIGTASGFFAFECEKRGASPVVATELPDVADWDTKSNIQYHGVNIPRSNQKDFKESYRILKSKVQLHYGTINDPLHETLGTFDWVIFGSLMTHLRDIMLALENVRLLTKGRAVVISSYIPNEEHLTLHWVQSDRPFDWWAPSKSLLPKMLLAVGFRKVEEIGTFMLQHKNGSEHHQVCLHAFA